jgi:DNA-binding transcriptional MerR regulator
MMADAGYLTIGKVVKRLLPAYPDLTVSKVRYLEDEGLLTPSRTPGGYRLYSTRDIKRLETILYLQKHRFLPLQVIREELDRAAEQGVDPEAFDVGVGGSAALESDSEETLGKLHPLERIPELTGVSLALVRQLSDQGLITLSTSPQGRELVDGRDFALIRAAAALRHFGIEPKNLRQYVAAANRESAMFEQALTVFRPRSGTFTPETREAFDNAFNQMLSLTSTVRETLVRREVRDVRGTASTGGRQEE